MWELLFSVHEGFCQLHGPVFHQYLYHFHQCIRHLVFIQGRIGQALHHLDYVIEQIQGIVVGKDLFDLVVRIQEILHLGFVIIVFLHVFAALLVFAHFIPEFSQKIQVYIGADVDSVSLCQSIHYRGGRADV